MRGNLLALNSLTMSFSVNFVLVWILVLENYILQSEYFNHIKIRLLLHLIKITDFLIEKTYEFLNDSDFT